MENAKHTPGPWKADIAAPFMIRDCFRRPVAECAIYLGPDIEEANARLIAAAPELLAALCEMLGAADVDCLDDNSNVWRSAMIDARAAIAKAKGE